MIGRPCLQPCHTKGHGIFPPRSAAAAGLALNTVEDRSSPYESQLLTADIRKLDRREYNRTTPLLCTSLLKILERNFDILGDSTVWRHEDTGRHEGRKQAGADKQIRLNCCLRINHGASGLRCQSVMPSSVETHASVPYSPFLDPVKLA